MKHLQKILFGIAAVVLIFFAVRDGLQYWRAFTTQDTISTPTPTPLPSTVLPEPATNEHISVSAPQRNTTVSLPFTVSGSARIFEGGVHIVLKDADHNILYQSLIKTRVVNTKQFSSFSHAVTHLQKLPASSQVTLEVFLNSPENDQPLDILSIPLVFDITNTRTIKIFFGNRTLNSESKCISVFSVERVIAKRQAPASTAIELLLKGVTSAEGEKGYISIIPPNVQMPRLVLAQGTATVDFREPIGIKENETCRTKTLRAQIEKTLYQFPTVSGVTILVEGEGVL